MDPRTLTDTHTHTHARVLITSFFKFICRDTEARITQIHRESDEEVTESKSGREEVTERATDRYVVASTHLAELSFLHSAETSYTLSIDMYIYEGLFKSTAENREKGSDMSCFRISQVLDPFAPAGRRWNYNILHLHWWPFRSTHWCYLVLFIN